MDTTNNQQVARDEALVPHVKRLRIGRSNFLLCFGNLYAGILGDGYYSSSFYLIQDGQQEAYPKASKAKSLSALSEVAMTEEQQLKLATKRSLQQTHISQASGSGTDEGTGSIPGVPDAPTDEYKEKISWNSTDEEGDDDKGKDD
nr:hypothetical protein [Tanacetum cinerariifolium]